MSGRLNPGLVMGISHRVIDKQATHEEIAADQGVTLRTTGRRLIRWGT